jgi:hypothetical protein
MWWRLYTRCKTISGNNTRVLLTSYFTRVLFGVGNITRVIFGAIIMENETATFTAFAGHRIVASGGLADVLRRTKEHIDAAGEGGVLIFEDRTGRQTDFDLRGTADEVVARAEGPKPGPGRPKLGVVSREVGLLPRQWEWLEAQPNGASAALRRLVDEARKREPEKERARQARDAAGKFMWGLAGDLPGFEEASRALFAGDWDGLKRLTADWPPDVQTHLARLLAAGGTEGGGQG